MTHFVQLSTTTTTVEEAHRIASALVEQRLAACVQILPQMRSVYRWKEQVEQADEALCLAKTRRSLLPQVDAVIQQLHSYECPEIIAVPIEYASDGYLQWLDEQLAE